MLSKALESFGLNKNKARLRRWMASAKRVGELEGALGALGDEALRAKAAAWTSACGASKAPKAGRFDGLLEEGLALGREASRRLLGMRHFDVQLVGAMALHEGMLAEMKTGEGKSLCLTLAAIYNAALGSQAHVVTVNEYLARRDAEAMAPLYEFFGLRVGLLEGGQSAGERREQYAKDVVYGVNYEFGFDYLRHNMACDESERRLVRGMGFAIVDEVDSILIDEARTPLIISGQEGDDLSAYAHCWEAALALDEKEDVEVDEKKRTVALAESGFEKVEAMFLSKGLVERGHHLYEIENNELLRALQACLSARFLFHRDVHYIVRDGKVLIVDENTGRLMADRRWSEGIHQAMEAKEGVEVLQESKTLATITYQNFFRLYAKLSGLTGTAMTQAAEFWSIYGLESVAIPTHMPMIRKDHPDVVYRGEKEKFKALAEEAKEAVKRGRPVLAGTSSVDESEKLSAALAALGVEHKLLNAKNHELEAQIVEEAGFAGRVTVATNMAGRGTDIVLGGNWSAIARALRESGEGEGAVAERKERWEAERSAIAAAGGLLVLGCARNESRRVDNQLRGRSGRQGDPGESKFFISLDDSLFRIYAQNGMLAMIDRHNMMPEGSSLQHPMLNRSLDKAQATVENHHYDMRKQLQDYDSVGAAQRAMLYRWRDEIIDAPSSRLWEMASQMVEQALEDASAGAMDPARPESWLSPAVRDAVAVIGPLPEGFDDWAGDDEPPEATRDRLLAHWEGLLDKAKERDPEGAHGQARAKILVTIDEAWQEHLTTLQSLMAGIHLRSYAQKDPKLEYKREGYAMFGRLRSAIVAEAAVALMAWAAGPGPEAESSQIQGSQSQHPQAEDPGAVAERMRLGESAPDGMMVAGSQVVVFEAKKAPESARGGQGEAGDPAA